MLKKHHSSHLLPALLGIIFLISGWLKGVDPYGTSLQMEEYFRVWGMDGAWCKYSMVWAIVLCAGELFLGLLLVFGIFHKLIAWAVCLLMAFFTVVTGDLAFTAAGTAIQDCGCFGEAFKISHEATFFKNLLLLVLAIGNILAVRHEKLFPKHGVGKWTALACLIFATAIPVHSALFLPPVDFLPYNRGTNLDGHPDLAVFNRQYEEVTDSLLNLSENKPLAIITTRKELMAEDWKKLKTFSTLAKQGDIALCLMSLPEQNKRNTMETYYADEVTLKSILRSEKGVLIVENSIIRAKWNLDTYPAKLIRHATRLKQLAAWNSWVAYRYGFCLLAGFLLIVWIRKKEKQAPQG